MLFRNILMNLKRLFNIATTHQFTSYKFMILVILFHS